MMAALLWNLLVLYLAYSVSRLAFLLTNWHLYAGTLSGSHALELFGAGLIFDTTAILYLNVPVILLMLLPLHWKERLGYYRTVRVLYVLLNFIGITANLMDCVYFPFTGKRTTASVFQEFSHEGAGSLGSIILHQAVQHWYLVLLGLLLTWMFWVLFRPRIVKAPVSLWKYYLVHIPVFLLAIPLCIIGMRGGVGKSTRPITLSNANEYAARPVETGIILNTPFSIMKTIDNMPFEVPHYMSDEEAQAIWSPLRLPLGEENGVVPSGGGKRGRNVVVLILESFSKQHIGFYNTLQYPLPHEKEKSEENIGAGGSFTPFLDSLCTHAALTWRYSYANGRKSIEAMPSVLSGLPNFVEPLFITPAALNHMSGLARELGEHEGYTTAFFHGAQNSSMGFHAFARATGFQKYFGRTEYNADPQTRGDEDFDGTWAVWDEEFLQFFARRLAEMKEPFMTALFTASSHDPFTLPERYRNVFPKGKTPLQECIAYTDYALRRFFETASREPWFENTLFVLTADHTSQQLDPFYTTSLGNFCVPIIFYAPSDSTLRGYDEERVVQQTDIMPTVLSYLRYDRPYIAFGQDMLSTPPEETFALHWLPEMRGYEYVHGDYLIQFDGQRVTSAYTYRTDFLLQHDILSDIPADTLGVMQQQMESVIQQYMQRMTEDELIIE